MVIWDDVFELGKIDDGALGRQLGVHKTSVFKARKNRGIKPAKRPGRQFSTNWHEIDFSKSDDEIANDVGCSRVTVSRRRREAGIYLRAPRCQK